MPEKTINTRSGGSCIIYSTKTPNDRMLEEAKFKAQKTQKFKMTFMLEVSENAIILKPIMAFKIPRYRFLGFLKNCGFGF